MSKSEFKLADEYQYKRSNPVNWVVSHSARYWYLPLTILLASIVNNFFASYSQVLIGRGFGIITSEDWLVADLARVALLTAGVVGGQGLFGLVRNAAAEFLAQRVERDSRDEFYVDLLGKDQTFHGRQRVGDIMARATNDVRSLNYMFNPGVNLIIDAAMGLLLPYLLIAQIRTELLLVPTIFIVLLVITLIDYNRRLNKVNVPMRVQFGQMNAGLAEAIAGIEVVKGNVQERHEFEKFTYNAGRYRDLFVKQGELQAVYLPNLVFSIALAGAFLHAILAWQGGRIELSDVIAYLGLIGVFRFATFVSLFSFSLVQLGLASAERLLEVVNTATHLDENEAGVEQPLAGEVVFEHVSFGYNGSKVLSDISFHVRPGQTVAIVGQTGSGKTTLTRLINRIFDADEGRVLVDGIDVRDWKLESLRSQISTIEQDIFLFSRSIADNIAFGAADASIDDIQQAAHEAQAHDFIVGFQDGYETEIGERGVTLSGGQRQRLAIARAFLTSPRILILDDSTSAIDSATEDRIQRAMQRISRQRTTFLITHRLSQIRWADHILLLQAGRLVDQGTHEELLARSPAYQRIFARYD